MYITVRGVAPQLELKHVDSTAHHSTQNMGNTQFIHTTCIHRIYKYITVHEVAVLLELVDVERKRLSCLKTCESTHGK